IQDPRLVAHVLRSAEVHDIPYQIRRPGGGGTDTGVIQQSRAGVPSATIGLAGRYSHTPAMMINLADYANMVRLAEATLRSLTAEIVKRDA
ncbi:MAG TPA: M42 family peptidase, partial [Anaerolineae bacterium]